MEPNVSTWGWKKYLGSATVDFNPPDSSSPRRLAGRSQGAWYTQNQWKGSSWGTESQPDCRQPCKHHHKRTAVLYPGSLSISTTAVWGKMEWRCGQDSEGPLKERSGPSTKAKGWLQGTGTNTFVPGHSWPWHLLPSGKESLEESVTDAALRRDCSPE